MIRIEFHGHGIKKMLHELKQGENFIFTPFDQNRTKYKVVEIIGGKYICENKHGGHAIVSDRYVWTKFEMSSEEI